MQVDQHYANLRSQQQLVAIGFAIAYALFMLSRIYFPDIESFRGEFSSYNYSYRVYSNNCQYVFLDEKGKKYVFELDTSSRKKIIPDDFEEGKIYTIYYDTLTDIIVGVKE